MWETTTDAYGLSGLMGGLERVICTIERVSKGGDSISGVLTTGLGGAGGGGGVVGWRRRCSGVFGDAGALETVAEGGVLTLGMQTVGCKRGDARWPFVGIR